MVLVVQHVQLSPWTMVSMLYKCIGYASANLSTTWLPVPLFITYAGQY